MLSFFVLFQLQTPVQFACTRTDTSMVFGGSIYHAHVIIDGVECIGKPSLWCDTTRTIIRSETIHGADQYRRRRDLQKTRIGPKPNSRRRAASAWPFHVATGGRPGGGVSSHRSSSARVVFKMTIMPRSTVDADPSPSGTTQLADQWISARPAGRQAERTHTSPRARPSYRDGGSNPTLVQE